MQLKLAQTYERLSDYARALESFTRAFALEPFNFDSCCGIARCLTYLRRFEQAENWLAHFPQDDVRHGWLHASRAFNEARANNRPGARTALQRLYALIAKFQDGYEKKRAAALASVWVEGAFARHPAPSAPEHGAGFAADLNTMRSADRVMLVGNSPRLIGAGLGESIDAADFVIRLNDFELAGFERDVGTRTDLWFSSANRVARPNAGAADFSRIWLAQPYPQHFPELPDFALARLGLPLTTANTRYLPPHIHTLTARLIYPRPSSGLRMIALLEFFLQRDYSIAGFSFFDDADMHYFDRGEKRLPVGEMHAIEFERDFVADVLEPFGHLKRL